MKKKVKIAIADDNPDVCETLKLILLKAGYSVDTVKDGYEALAHLKAKSPHILILDLLMPEKSGVEILSAVREVSPETKIIIYTAVAKYENSKYARAADRFLLKADTSPEKLLQAIKELL